jgi:hypothetical protein
MLIFTKIKKYHLKKNIVTGIKKVHIAILKFSKNIFKFKNKEYEDLYIGIYKDDSKKIFENQFASGLPDNASIFT